MKKTIWLTIAIWFSLMSSLIAQVKVPKDSLNQRIKTDSLDFKSSPAKDFKRSPGDSLKWNPRDSFQLDDKNPKRVPKPGRDTIH